MAEVYYDSYNKSVKCCTKKSRIGLVAKTAMKIEEIVNPKPQ